MHPAGLRFLIAFHVIFFPQACSARLPVSQLHSMLLLTVSVILLGGGSLDAWFSMKEKGLQLC